MVYTGEVPLKEQLVSTLGLRPKTKSWGSNLATLLRVSPIWREKEMKKQGGRTELEAGGGWWSTLVSYWWRNLCSGTFNQDQVPWQMACKKWLNVLPLQLHFHRCLWCLKTKEGFMVELLETTRIGVIDVLIYLTEKTFPNFLQWHSLCQN